MCKFAGGKKLTLALTACVLTAGCRPKQDKTQINEENIMEEKLNLTQEWDKVFPQSDKVIHGKITFHNRYGVTLAADLYVPENAEGRLPAIAMSGPYGSV